MDSFYEVPRCALKPTSVGTIPSTPLVPEVSMIYQSNNCTSNDSMYLSYKAWKERSQNKVMAHSIERDFQKQIRFENAPITNQPLISTTNNSDFLQSKVQPFEQIYMANIPNRHLDLSIVEPAKERHVKVVENITTNMEVTKKLPVCINNSRKCKGCCLLINESNQSGVANKNRIIDLYNYKHDKTEPKHFANKEISNISEHKCNCKEVQYNSSSNNGKEDLTVKDLLKIIQQQNEQLLILQKQVATLINNKDSEKESRTNPMIFDDQCKTSTQLENRLYNKQPQFNSKKGPLHQISLDVMTSFELSIRRPTNPKLYEAVHNTPKICEVTETESTMNENFLDGIVKPKDITLSLNEPQLKVPERCPTPAGSIKIDMKDYSSDSSEEEEQPCPEWTFYNNIMMQVNHILKKSGVNCSSTSSNTEMKMAPGDVIKQNMMRKVKETTIKHLKSIGVHVPQENMDEFYSGCKDVNSNGNEISFAVQQLLMKYLPNEHLAKITTNHNNFQKPKQTGRIKRRPEFSMATVQYMQKYNLLNDNHNYSPMLGRDNFDRILDTTAIRQQPKLL
ncbi:hypothetical protein FQR65_LT05621 [Abscondita terminalis]|nr:hypothetical protein FQR65_LT05621 [Abscondita terminalis]